MNKMAKTREVACQYYVCEGLCEKGKGGIFRGICQTCSTYLPIKGGRVARPDRRKEKINKIIKKETREW
jgi:hypothetical protein